MEVELNTSQREREGCHHVRRCHHGAPNEAGATQIRAFNPSCPTRHEAWL